MKTTSLTAAGIFLCCLTVNAAMMQAKPAPKSWVVSVINKPKSVADKLLGKGTEADSPDPNVYDYKVKGLIDVSLMFSEKGKCEYIEMTFDKDPGTWQAALAKVSIKPDGLKAVKHSRDVGDDPPIVSYTVTGKAAWIKNWTIEFTKPYKGSDGETESMTKAQLTFYKNDL